MTRVRLSDACDISTDICLNVSVPGDSVVKNPPANAGDLGLTPGLERSPGEGNGNPLQYYCLENPMDGGAWQAPRGRQESDTA